MDYNVNLWNKYTDENKQDLQSSRFDLIYSATMILNAKKVCEAGCNIGNNLTAFPTDYDITGFDMNEYAIQQAKSKFPKFNFSIQNITGTSFSDNEFDLVFTRGVLIHIHSNAINNSMNELLRISNKWVLNLEYFGEDGKMIDWKRGKDLLWYRNMKELWKKFNVEIVSDCEIPIEIDKRKMHLTLIKKL